MDMELESPPVVDMGSAGSDSGSAPGADHLCVLVHGLWGNPTHLDYLSNSLKTRYPGLHLLLCKRNSGNFTYDGIETGAERVTKEIEVALEEFSKQGVEIRKLSIIGYSLGGLVSRYAIGLLYSRGWFDKIEPVNFTTFATPHLGVRTPLLGYFNHLWNVLGARVLSASGRQLFIIDNFRETGRPLLSILADPDSIFYKGLSCFPNKVLYANIVNDWSTCFYTSGISKNDPFANLDKIAVNYIPGYEPIVLDHIKPFSPPKKAQAPDGDTTLGGRIAKAAHSVAKSAPRVLLLVLFVPIVVVGFLCNSLVQTITSKRRIKLHLEKEGEREGYHYYRRLPFLLVEEMQEAMEGVMEDINQMQEPEHLPPGAAAAESTYFNGTAPAKGLRNVASAPESMRGGKKQGKVGKEVRSSAPLGSPAPGKFDVGSEDTTGASSTPTTDSVGCVSVGAAPTVMSFEHVGGTSGSSLFQGRVASMDGDTDDEGEDSEDPSKPLISSSSTPASGSSRGQFLSSSYVTTSGSTSCATPPEEQVMEFPTLALTQSQFEMIENLDGLGWRKFPVWIHKERHSHAAIIVRTPWKGAGEGKVVVSHWLEKEFVV